MLGGALGAILKTAASSVLGDKMKDIAVEKVTGLAREKLGLPPEVTQEQINAQLAEDPVAYSQVMEAMNNWRIEQERTFQTAIEQQGESDRQALMSDSAYVRNARPTMIYLGGLSCFGLIVLGGYIAFNTPDKLVDYAEMVSAIAMPLTALLAAGGVYAYRRTTDKAIGAGQPLPPLFGRGN